MAEDALGETDPDVQRMLAFSAGDTSAFDGLFRRWAEPLLHYLERMVGDTGTEEPLPTPRGDGSRQIAETAIRSEPSEPTAAETTGAETRPEGIQLATVSEEELAIGLAYETLTNLEVIENLELLELMAALDVQEQEPPDAAGERG